MEIKNVFSAFDGMSGGQLALYKQKITYENYFASEIDKDAIFIAKKNFPNTKHLGDIKNIKGEDLPQIDLMIGGSPCQNLSLAVINNIKHNKGLQGEKSGLFYEYLRLLTELKPKYFLLENVGGMKIKDKNLISEALGVQPIEYLNSNLFSAQDRDRLYWTNIPVSSENLIDKNITLKDIILNEEQVEEKFWYDKPFTYNGSDKKVEATLHINGHDILKRVYNINGKCGTLTCCTGGNKQKKIFQNGRCRKLTPLEYERLQTATDNYTEGVSTTSRYNMLGNGFTIDVIAYILSFMR